MCEQDSRFDKGRAQVVEALGEIKSIKNFFYKNGLGGLMSSEGNSVIKMLNIYDSARMKKTGERSIFDTKESVHSHLWKFDREYLGNQENFYEAAIHIARENFPNLLSSDRSAVIHEFAEIEGLVKRLMSLGLHPIERSMSKLVRQFTDAIDNYHGPSKQPSLFDKTQREYLQFDSCGRLLAA